MENRNVRTVRIVAWFVALSITVSFCVLFKDSVLQICVSLASWSAKSFLPQQGLTLRVQDETEQRAVTQETVSTTAQTDEKTIVETEKKAVTASLSLTDTDSDIRKLMKEYDGENDEKGGNIQKKTYTTEGMTDSFGLVRMKNTNETQVNLEKLLSEKADLTVNKDEPSVLIFHTHTTETYQITNRDFYAADFAPRSESESVNMVRVGKAICQQLERAGYNVIHDTEIHDGTYSGAYAHSRKSIEEYLKKYPSIEIVLDIHRDGIQLKNGTKIKPVAEIDGKQAAQIMIISGCQEEGNGITNLPDWRCNLTFAAQLQNKLEENFKGITRPLYFCARSYNMNVTHCSLLIEIGSDSNTLEEAVYSGKCLGVALSKLMDEYNEEK